MLSRLAVLSSIRYKIILPYAIVTLLLTVFGVFIITYLVTDSFEERFKNQIKDAGRIASQEVLNQEAHRLNISRQIVNTVGMADAVTAQDWQTVADLIRPIMTTNETIEQILVVNKQGQEQRRFYREVYQPEVGLFNQDINSGQNLIVWPAVAQVLADSAGKTKAIALAYDALLEQYAVYTVAPLRTQNGVDGAVLVGNYLRNQLHLLKGVAAADILLLNRNGELIPDLTTVPVGLTEQQLVSELLSAARFQEIVIKRETETFMDDVILGETGYRLAYTPFILQGQVEGMLVIALSTDFVTQTNNLNRNSLALIFGCGILMLLAVGILTAQQIINPITHLVEITQAITQGDLQRRANLTQADEVGLLAANFNRMTAELERKNRVLEEQAGRLSAILHSMTDGVIVQDLSGQIVTRNPALDALLTRLQREQRKQTAWQWQEDVLTDLLRQIAPVEAQQPHRLEIGQHTLSSVATPILTSDQQQLGTVIVLRDITREIESEKLKDKFISSTSHELKTPLLAIKGYQAFLKMRLRQSAQQLEAQAYAQIMENLTHVEKQLADLDTVVQSLLDLSQIDANALDLQLEPLDLATVIQTVFEEWATKMAYKGLDFVWSAPSDPLWVQGDVVRLQQLFRHLIKNAHDYTLAGQVRVQATQHNGQVQVIIEDTGVGVTADDERYLFTRFFRALHDENTYNVAGAGLGLYISQAIIEQHQGQIWLESEAYQGSKVYVTLPATTKLRGN